MNNTVTLTFGTNTAVTVEKSKDEYAINACYDNLVTAIIRQAADDYIAAIVQMYFAKDIDTRRVALDVKRETEQFFHSDWYRQLTSVDGDCLIADLKKAASDKIRNIIKKRYEEEQYYETRQNTSGGTDGITASECGKAGLHRRSRGISS